jgi:hypothetical protein
MNATPKFDGATNGAIDLAKDVFELAFAGANHRVIERKRDATCVGSGVRQEGWHCAVISASTTSLSGAQNVDAIQLRHRSSVEIFAAGSTDSSCRKPDAPGRSLVRIAAA